MSDWRTTPSLDATGALRRPMTTAIEHPKKRRKSIRMPGLLALATAVAILPIAFAVSLSLARVNDLTQLSVFYVTLLVLTLAHRSIFTSPARSTKLSFTDYAVMLPVVLLLSQALGALGYGLLGWHDVAGDIPLRILAPCLVLFALIEELFFRGLVQQRAASAMRPIDAAVLAAGLYGLAMLSRLDAPTAIFGAAMGVGLSALYYKKPSTMLTFGLNAFTKLVCLGLVMLLGTH